MIRIVTDSAADITREEAQQLGITIIPLTVTFGDQSYMDGLDISVDEFYDKLVNSGVHPTTSQPSPQQYEDVFSEARDNGDTIILLSVSQNLSGSHNCATMVKKQGNYDNVYIVDTLLGVGALRILVFEAIKLANTMPPAELVKHLEKLRSRIRISAYVDSLEYLRRGGRISRAVAAVTSLISIKPIIGVENGFVKMIGKAFGTKKTLAKACSNYLNDDLDENYQPCFEYGSDSTLTEQMIDICYGADTAEAKHHKGLMSRLSPIMGVYSGPIVALVAYVVKSIVLV